MNKITLEELSAGGVVYRLQGRRYEFLIGKHSGYHKWVLPKGLVEKGEGPVQAATREVEEEVGVRARVVDLAPVKTIEYWYYAIPNLEQKTTRRVKVYQEQPAFAKATARQRVHKRVIFYLMELVEDSGQSGWEMEERKWVGYEEAKSMLAFESEQGVLEAAWQVLGAPAGT